MRSNKRCGQMIVLLSMKLRAAEVQMDSSYWRLSPTHGNTYKIQMQIHMHMQIQIQIQIQMQIKIQIKVEGSGSAMDSGY